MKLGDYYTIDEVAEKFDISKQRVNDIIKAGDLAVEYFGDKPAIHEFELDNLVKLRAHRQLDKKKSIREELLKNDFVYFAHPNGGSRRGIPIVAGEMRRGWHRCLNGKFIYYGITAIAAFNKWKDFKN